MKHAGQVCCLLFPVLLILSIFAVDFACAEVGVITPEKPSFGVSYQTHPVSVQPVFGVDPLTGKAVITKAGYTTIDEQARVEIVNQPFVPYKDSNGNNIQLYYNIRWKEPSNNSWVSVPPSYLKLTQNSDGDQTICIFDFKGNLYPVSNIAIDVMVGQETDFQVQAAIGYYTASNVFVGNTSDWTNPQVIQHASHFTISPSPSSITPTPSDSSQSPTATPLEPNGVSVFLGLDWVGIAIVVLFAVIVVLLVFVVVFLLRRSKTSF